MSGRSNIIVIATNARVAYGFKEGYAALAEACRRCGWLYRHTRQPERRRTVQVFGVIHTYDIEQSNRSATVPIYYEPARSSCDLSQADITPGVDEITQPGDDEVTAQGTLGRAG